MTYVNLQQLLISPPVWLAVLFSVGFAIASRQARLLTTRGAVAAGIVGYIIFGLGGGKFVIPLLVFFLTSSLLSRLGGKTKRHTNKHHEKGATRDAVQVLANGGAAALVVVCYALVVHRWPVYETRPLLVLYLAALSSVNADTWATELGTLYRGLPRLLSTWKPVPAGTSGAISFPGTLASLAGAVIIPLASLIPWHLDLVELVIVIWSGMLGCFADSILGATLQAVYRNPTTDELTEKPNAAGKPLELVRGLRWVNNDMVNLLSSLIAVGCAWALCHFTLASIH